MAETIRHLKANSARVRSLYSKPRTCSATQVPSPIAFAQNRLLYSWVRRCARSILATDRSDEIPRCCNTVVEFHVPRPDRLAVNQVLGRRVRQRPLVLEHRGHDGVRYSLVLARRMRVELRFRWRVLGKGLRRRT